MRTEVHHQTPQCLVRMLERAEEGDAEARIEWYEEATRWSVPVTIDRHKLKELVEGSTVELDRDEHRQIHQTDFQRWGRRGGLETFRKYGRPWMGALALRRWRKISAEELQARQIERLQDG